jgi:succinate dehydrogenase/fumarate reductase flavoprotein subunit
MNQEMAKEFGNNFYYYKDVQGFITQHDNFSELANNINVDYNNLEKTINSYNDAFEKNIDEFNKTTFPYKFNLSDTIYSMIITPSIHYSMGGLKINNKGEVLNSNNETIKGLFGAGEVTGGVHGGNRLGGNSLAEGGVYGRISADSAVDYISNKGNSSEIIPIVPIKYKSSSGGIGTGGIVGILVGGIVVLIAVTLGSIICGQKSNIPQNNNNETNQKITLNK